MNHSVRACMHACKSNVYAYALTLTYAHTLTHVCKFMYSYIIIVCVSFNSHCLTVGTTHICRSVPKECHSDNVRKKIGHHKSLFVKILCI